MKMKNQHLVLLLLLLTSFGLVFGQTGTITGKVTSAETETPLSGANIHLIDSNQGTISNPKGDYTLLNVNTGKQQLQVSYMGYKPVIVDVQVSADKTFQQNIVLNPNVIKTQGVVVTSTRFEKELSNVALPVSVVSKAQIQASLPVTLADAVKSEPGLALGHDGVWGTRLVVRGLSKHNLVTLVDGNRVDTAPDMAAGLSMVDVNDIQRIEVIRGAGSALYGTGAIGGVINIITNNGYYTERFQISGSVQSGYSSVNQLGTGHLNLTASSKNYYVYLTTMYRSAKNLQTPNGELPNSQFSDQNFAAKVGFRPHAKHELKLNFQQFDATDVGIPGGGSLFPSMAEVRYPTEQRQMFSAEFISCNWSSWLPQTSVKYFIQNIQRDVENIPHVVKNLPGTPPKRMSLLKVTPGANHKVNGFQFQSDWLLANNQALRAHLIAGIDYWKKRYNGYRLKFQKIEVLNAVDNSVINTINKETADLPLPNSSYASLGFYAQDEMRLFKERFILTLGGRYDQIQTKNDQSLNPLYEITDGVRNDQPANQKVLWPESSDKNRSWSGNLGLLYRLHSNLKFTFTAAKSFRAPSLEERYQFIDLGSLVKIGDPELAPEKGSFADFGLQFQWKNIGVTGNVFWNELTDMVVEEPSTYEGRSALQKVNVGQARLIGFDGRLDLNLFPTLTLSSSIAYVKGEDTQNDTPLPLMPPLNGSVGLNWKSPWQVNLDVSANMHATQDRIVTGELRTPGYTTFDLYLTSRPWQWGFSLNRVTIGVENIGDRAYRNHLATNRGLITTEPGRNILVRWAIDF